jgi:uncharacterized Zn finger protein
MESDALHTDGNGVAGLLQEIFATEITTSMRVCDSCGSAHPIGAHRAYHGAGTVMRCPSCGAVAAVITSLPDANLVGFSGVWRLARTD